MTDYNKLVEALRHCATRSNGCVTCAGCPMSEGYMSCLDWLKEEVQE
jgi:hypothetical protein